MANAASDKDFIEIARIDHFQDGMMKEFTINGHNILITRVNDQYYAVENSCPHMGEKLTNGNLEGTVITCKRNDSKFDLVDGRVIRWTDWTGIRASVSKLFRSPRPLTTYPIKIEGDSILIQI